MSLDSCMTATLKGRPTNSARIPRTRPPALVSAIETECDRLHRAVHETYIDQPRMPAPAA